MLMERRNQQEVKNFKKKMDSKHYIYCINKHKIKTRENKRKYEEHANKNLENKKIVKYLRSMIVSHYGS